VKEEKQLIVVQAQKSRHIVEIWGRIQRRISPANREHVWMGAVQKDVLLILYAMALHKSQVGEVL